MATTVDRAAAVAAHRTPRLPPGPRTPRWLQTLGFIVGGRRYLEVCRRRYGNAVTMSTLFDQGFVMVFDPELVKQVFRGAPGNLHAGEANALLGPIVGERSVLLLDGEQHLRHRRLLLPPFHGARMRLYEDVVQKAADAEIDSWPVAQPFALLPHMQSLTLHVILQAVFGYEPGPTEEELARRLRAFIEPLTQNRNLMRMALAMSRRSAQAEGFQRRREAVDEILLAEIERRRNLREPELAQNTDVFSALLLAEDESGERLTDGEVRDELMTLLLAGHETTATGLAWAFDLLLHHPDALSTAKQQDPAYLDAVAKEALRLRPVIPGVGRVVRNQPFELGEWVIPPGHEINPSIRMIHARPDLYPNPNRFDPDRFLTPDAPDTYTWLPFGGGTRRCLGASFALMEMRIVLSRVLEKTELRPVDPKPDKPVLRVITLSPKRGVRVLQP